MPAPFSEYNASTTRYRYGFNGKENDNEVKGNGNQIDFGARIYDSRLGRWLSVDPLQAKYSYEGPYAFVSGNPLIYKDADGRDKYFTIVIKTDKGDYPILQVQTDKGVYNYNSVNYWSKEASFKVAYNKVDQFTYLTIDLRANAKPDNLFTLSQKAKVVDEMSSVEVAIEKIGRLLSFSNSGDRSIQEFGFVLKGGTRSGGLYQMTDKRGKLVEVLDVENLLNSMSSFKDLPGINGFPGVTSLLKELNPTSKNAAVLLDLAERLENASKALETSGNGDKGLDFNLKPSAPIVTPKPGEKNAKGDSAYCPSCKRMVPIEEVKKGTIHNMKPPKAE